MKTTVLVVAPAMVAAAGVPLCAQVPANARHLAGKDKQDLPPIERPLHMADIASVGSIPPHIPLYAAVVVAGALLGTELGSRRLAPRSIKYLLALVLLVAGLKMMFT